MYAHLPETDGVPPSREVAIYFEELPPSLLEFASSQLLSLERSTLTRISRINPRQRDKDGSIIFAEFELAQRLPT